MLGMDINILSSNCQGYLSGLVAFSSRDFNLLSLIAIYPKCLTIAMILNEITGAHLSESNRQSWPFTAK
jgi:hypothetical protein